MDGLEQILTGAAVTIITAWVIHEVVDSRKKSKEKKEFIKILQIELDRLTTQILENKAAFYTEFGINNSKDSHQQNMTLAYIQRDTLPEVLCLGIKEYKLTPYDENSKSLIHLEDELRKKVIKLFERLLAMNVCMERYEDDSQSGNADYGVFRKKQMLNYFKHLKLADKEIGPILESVTNLK